MKNVVLLIGLFYCSVTQLYAQSLPPKSTNPFRDGWEHYFLNGGGPGTYALPFESPLYYFPQTNHPDFLLESEYLISANGKYIFKNIDEGLVNGIVTRYWAVINIQTGEHIYDTKKYIVKKTKFIDHYDSPYLAIMPATPFTSLPCEAPRQGKNCQVYDDSKKKNSLNEHIYDKIVGVPLLVVHSAGYNDIPNYIAGIPSAFQHLVDPLCYSFNFRVPVLFSPNGNDVKLSKVLVPKTNETYVKNPSTGVYSVPVAKQVWALKILDDGNLVMVNRNNKILYESASGVQQLIDTRVNKKFKDINANFKKGLGLISQGNLELINTNITQKKAAVVLIANTYALMTPGTSRSILNVFGTGSIEVKTMQFALGSSSVTKKNVDEKLNSKTAKSEVEKLASTLMVYPNPTSGLVNISTATVDEKILYINIMDISGRNIQRYADTDEVDLSENAAGIYFYKVETSKWITYTGKIIKQ